MSPSDQDPANRPSRPLVGPPRFQFSLAWLLIAITVVAVLLGLSTSMRYALSLIIRCVLPTPLVICAIFGRGYLRAFAIGALMPWLTIIANVGSDGSLMSVFLTVLLSAVCGFIAAATWRWVRGTIPPQ